MTKKFVLAALLGLIASPALAHHPLNGLPMETFGDGLLSGVGHPLLGFDHLFFVVAVGIAALYTGYQRLAPLAYIVAMALGCIMMSAGVGLPLKEIVVGFSLLAVGAIILSGHALNITLALALFAGFGLFHGSAFGDAIAAQEAATAAPVLSGYLIGLSVLQYVVAISAGAAVKALLSATEATALQARVSGAIVAGVGLYLTLENVETAFFNAFGWTT